MYAECQQCVTAFRLAKAISVRKSKLTQSLLANSVFHHVRILEDKNILWLTVAQH